MKVLWYNVLACGLSPRMILHQICFPCTKSGMWLPKPLKVIKHFQKKMVVLTETPCFNFLADLHRINEFFLWILRTSLCLSLLKIYLMNHHMAYCKYALFFFYYSEPFIERKKTLLYHKYPLNHCHSGTVDVILKQLFAIENTLTCKFSMLLISLPPCELFQTYSS